MASLYEKLEAKGEVTVRRELAEGLYGTPGSTRYAEVETWLEYKEFQRQQQEAAARRQREDRAEIREETRDRVARSRAKRAEIVAWVSIGIAIIGFLLSLSRG